MIRSLIIYIYFLSGPYIIKLILGAATHLLLNRLIILLPYIIV